MPVEIFPTPADASLIEFSAEGAVADIRLNRPDRRNAFSDDLARSLILALRRLDEDASLNAAVLSGNGRGFSSGADVQQRQLRTRDELVRLGGPEGYGAKASSIFTYAVNWKPVVTAVHGFAIGMGLGVMLGSDFIVAEEGTRLQVTETPRGISGVRYMELLRLRGTGAFAVDVTLTGRWFTAEEAHAAGVIDRLVPQGQAYAEAHRVARQMAANPPLSVRATVRARRLAMDAAEREASKQTDALRLHLTEDFAESARAFMEKRDPRPFKGC